ncbi:MAG: 30S ribosomal protein S8 [Candidatus Kappaea frigidicola]|nr:30S ribosomal protein S8 [Candidatus Kappaea frigidicola]
MLTDLVANVLTMIRNAVMRKKETVDIPSSKMINEIMRIFKEEGFIKDYKDLENKTQAKLKIYLKYNKDNSSAISHVKKITKPGFRVYSSKNDIPTSLGGLGVTILTTPKGILTDKQAHEQGVGGEIICQIW